MKFSNLFRKKSEKILLGRWGRTCDTMNEIKVNWANIDNCGTCSNHEIKYYPPIILPPTTATDVVDEHPTHFIEYSGDNMYMIPYLM